MLQICQIWSYIINTMNEMLTLKCSLYKGHGVRNGAGIGASGGNVN